jgi:transposase-like protein
VLTTDGLATHPASTPLRTGLDRNSHISAVVPSALHTVEQHANNPVEADHGRLKARLRPMRGLKRHRSARVLAAGHAFAQNLRRGHCDIATKIPSSHRRVDLADLALTI